MTPRAVNIPVRQERRRPISALLDRLGRDAMHYFGHFGRRPPLRLAHEACLRWAELL